MLCSTTRQRSNKGRPRVDSDSTEARTDSCCHQVHKRELNQGSLKQLALLHTTTERKCVRWSHGIITTLWGGRSYSTLSFYRTGNWEGEDNVAIVKGHTIQCWELGSNPGSLRNMYETGLQAQGFDEGKYPCEKQQERTRKARVSQQNASLTSVKPRRRDDWGEASWVAVPSKEKSAKPLRSPWAKDGQ